MPQDISRQKNDTKCIVALGANKPSHAGKPRETVLASVKALTSLGIRIIAGSRLYSTPCFPAGAGPDYVNAALVLATTRSAEDLLALLHEIEQQFERKRDVRWGARTLDLDLLDHGGQILPDDQTWTHWYRLPPETQVTRAPERLILPHPRLHERAFVLVPMADVAPGWRHPVLDRSVSDLIAALPPESLGEIKPIDNGESLALFCEDR